MISETETSKKNEQQYFQNNIILDISADEKETFYSMAMPYFILSLPIKVLPQIILMFNCWSIMNTTFLEIYNLISLMRVLIVIQAAAAHTKYEKTRLVCKKLGVDTSSVFST